MVRSSTLVNNRLAKIISGICLIFFCAQARIPLEPVPITLHSSGVLILALCYKKSDAMYAVLGYILMGVIGMPMFSSFNSGITYLMGYTGGYIFGMILCVYVVATMQEKFGEDSWAKLIMYSIIGAICLVAMGISQLALHIGMAKALKFGLYPFIIPGIAKALFTGSSVKLIRKKLRKN